MESLVCQYICEVFQEKTPPITITITKLATMYIGRKYNYLQFIYPQTI